jgi:hypothetical protein
MFERLAEDSKAAIEFASLPGEFATKFEAKSVWLLNWIALRCDTHTTDRQGLVM